MKLYIFKNKINNNVLSFFTRYDGYETDYYFIDNKDYPIWISNNIKNIPSFENLNSDDYELLEICGNFFDKAYYSALHQIDKTEDKSI